MNEVNTTREIVCRHLNIEPDKLKIETDFTTELDSLDALECILALEEEFDIEIPDEDATKMRSLKDIVDYINTKRVVFN